MQNLGSLGDALYAKIEEIGRMNESVKQLEAEKRAIEEQLFAGMDDIGTDIIRGERATISISETVRPQCNDWDKFYAFVNRHKAPHLLERRIAAGAYKEIKEKLKRDIPGVTEFTQRRLNVRKS